ncbi:MAG: rod shape-determining protein RodA, partial [Clostridia bacterium]|nr:rod shape-determining protein RodA [Clostridia bacterium]
MFKKYDFRRIDIKLILLVVATTILGILIIGSAKESVQMTQVYGMILGLVCMLIVSLIDYHLILKFSWVWYVLGIVLLALVHFFGTSVNNAVRWIELFGIRFQPSEVVKIILILFYAQFIMKHIETINTVRVLLVMVALLIPPLFFIMEQPDLSTSIMLCLLFCVVLFVGGLSYKIIGVLLVIAIPSVIIFFSLVLQPNQSLINDYQQTRILAWLEPEKYPDIAYQQLNSITAIGSGQLSGKGLYNNVVGSVKNGNFISEPQTDFIFAIAGEELGFIGGCAIIILLALISLECLSVARKAKDEAGEIIACGMAGLIAFQSFIYIGVTTGLLPNTGLPLPFISYGLTSLVSLYIGMGFVINVRLQTP